MKTRIHYILGSVLIFGIGCDLDQNLGGAGGADNSSDGGATSATTTSTSNSDWTSTTTDSTSTTSTSTGSTSSTTSTTSTTSSSTTSTTSTTSTSTTWTCNGCELVVSAYQPVDIDIDNENIYWIEQGSLNQLKKSGGAIISLADASNGQFFEMSHLRVAGEAVYYTGYILLDTSTVSIGVQSVPINGGDLTVVSTPLDATEILMGHPTSLAVYGDSVYWGSYWGSDPDNMTGSVYEASISGGDSTTTLLYGGSSPFSIVADATDIYWIRDPWLTGAEKTSRSDHTTTQLLSTYVQSVAQTSTHVFLTDGENGGTLYKISKSNGTTESFSIAGYGRLITYAEDVYVAHNWDSTAMIAVIGKVEGDSIVEVAEIPVDGHSAFAADDSYIYWTIYGTSTDDYNDGAIMRISK